MKSPEALEPGNTHRTTASVSYGAAGDGPFAATLLWGRNDERHGRGDAYLVEAAWQMTPRDQVYGRLELVQKDETLLATKALDASEAGAIPATRVGAYTAGYVRDFPWLRSLRTGAGADVTVYSFARSLEPVYGSFPVSLHAFLRVRWGAAHGGAHAGHPGM